MIKIGEFQILTIARKVDFGVYLTDGELTATQQVLLPVKQLPEGSEVGDEISVFIYRDSQDRLIATTARPYITMHETAVLRVREVTKIGAFLDWGLEKDLLLPFAQQTVKVRAEESYPVALYVDKSGRLAATMKVYEYLRTDSPYERDERVEGVVYELNDRFGAYVAVDGKYSAMIPKRELVSKVNVGDSVTCRIIEVRPDGKLTLALRDKAYQQIEADAQRILAELEAYSGVLPFNDKASPETIQRAISMSKNEFKRAVGHLLKEGRIEIGENCIRLI